MNAWRVRAVVFDQLGVSDSEQTDYFRCVVCDSVWAATISAIYPKADDEIPGDLRVSALPRNRDAANSDAVEVLRGVPQSDLPPSIAVGPVRHREWDGDRLVVPIPERLVGSWTGTPYQSRVAQLGALALMLDVALPDVDEQLGATYTFQKSTYVDATGRLHVGYGIRVPGTFDWARIEQGCVIPEAGRVELAPSPGERRLDAEGGLVAFGAGVLAPVPLESAFNCVVVDSQAPAAVAPSSEAVAPWR